MRPREYIPLFWSTEEFAWLRGSTAANRAAEDARLTEDDYQSCLQPVIGRHADRLPGDFTLDAFRRAASLVASRAFGVDSFHGAWLSCCQCALGLKLVIDIISSCRAVYGATG